MHPPGPAGRPIGAAAANQAPGARAARGARQVEGGWGRGSGLRRPEEAAAGAEPSRGPAAGAARPPRSPPSLCPSRLPARPQLRQVPWRAPGERPRAKVEDEVCAAAGRGVGLSGTPLPQPLELLGAGEKQIIVTPSAACRSLWVTQLFIVVRVAFFWGGKGRGSGLGFDCIYDIIYKSI